MSGVHSPQHFTGGPESPAAGLDSSSAMVRAAVGDVDAMLRALVARLSAVPGLAVSVSYHHGKLRRFLGDLPYINDLNRKAGPIEQIGVVAGPHTYRLHCDSGMLRCGRDPGGAELSFSAWAKDLLAEIARENLVNHDSLVSLRQLVEHDRVR
jgi:hypothetical protein